MPNDDATKLREEWQQAQKDENELRAQYIVTEPYTGGDIRMPEKALDDAAFKMLRAAHDRTSDAYLAYVEFLRNSLYK